MYEEILDMDWVISALWTTLLGNFALRAPSRCVCLACGGMGCDLCCATTAMFDSGLGFLFLFFLFPLLLVEAGVSNRESALPDPRNY